MTNRLRELQRIRSDEDCANTSGASHGNFMDALATAMALEAENT